MITGSSKLFALNNNDNKPLKDKLIKTWIYLLHQNLFLRYNLNQINVSAHLSWKLKWTFVITSCPVSVFVYPSIRPSVCQNIFSYFWLLLRAQANVNHTWYKAYLSKVKIVQGHTLFQGESEFRINNNLLAFKKYSQKPIGQKSCN